MYSKFVYQSDSFSRLDIESARDISLPIPVLLGL